jgi:hypothetical protein
MSASHDPDEGRVQCDDTADLCNRAGMYYRAGWRVQRLEPAGYVVSCPRSAQRNSVASVFRLLGEFCNVFSATHVSLPAMAERSGTTIKETAEAVATPQPRAATFMAHVAIILLRAFAILLLAAPLVLAAALLL